MTDLGISKTFSLNKEENIKAKVLNWLQQFSTFCFLDNNQYSHQERTNELLVGAGVARKFEMSGRDALPGLQKFIEGQKSWLFGHLAYGLQTPEHPAVLSIEPSVREDKLQFSDACFFEPEVVLRINDGGLEVLCDNPDAVFESICAASEDKKSGTEINAVVQNKIDRPQYVNIIQKLQEHIHRGDCYEINFCQEFFAENADIDPFVLYGKLNAISPNPFSALYRGGDKWLICASPERFLQKKGRQLLSQPIKGTLPRTSEPGESLAGERLALQTNLKEKAENVMVVDLVRNDLSRVCKQGTVKVDELFGVYSFPQVHQMISTVSGELEDDVNFENIINATFPMGSMTGAPKIRVMQLIDQYEKSNRGIFSGTVGYITPNEDFDFNVVIRSLMYNQATKYLSFQAGSGITIYADAEKEWDECMVKARAIKEILRN